MISWDLRPLRERELPHDEEGSSADGAANLPDAGWDVDWRNMEVPHASQIRGIARIQPPLGSKGPGGSLASKGWKEPPQLRPGPDPGLLGLPRAPRSHPVDAGAQRRTEDAGAQRRAEGMKPQTGGSVVNRTAPPLPQRGRTCPPLRRVSPPPDRRPAPPQAIVAARRPSGDADTEEMAGLPRSRFPPRLATLGVAPPPRRIPPHAGEDKVATPGIRRRGRSEHSYRMGRVGRIVVQPRERY